MTRPLRTAASILVFAAVYFCCGRFGLALASVNPSTSAVWPPTGIALAVLLLAGTRLWPGVFLGAFVVNIVTPLAPEATPIQAVGKTLGIAVGNTLEAVVGAWLVRQFAGGSKAFEQTQNIFKFAYLAAILSTAISATVGVASLCLSNFASWDRYPTLWLIWWLGDMVSDLIVAPLLMIWAMKPLPPLKPAKVLEAAGLLVSLLAIGGMIFLGMNPVGDPRLPLEYLALLPLLWATFRFGRRGAISAAFIMSSIALRGTIDGLGPFATVDPDKSLMLLQAFMGTSAIVALVLAAIVAERKRAQSELARANAELELRVQERTAELRETNSQLEDFVHSIAHDLRAPLRSMNSFSKLLLMDYASRLDDVARDYIQRIGRSAETMDALVLDLLAYGRVARSEIELAPVNVESAWKSALAQYEEVIKDKNACVETASPFPLVRAHEATLTQVLANLLGNALKFVRPDVTPHIRLWAEKRPGCVRLWIADNGVGIAPEHQQRMFGLFEQLNGRKYGGTGIGLSIVRKGIERMGGRVGVESELNRGSRFWIELSGA